ncbi:MAG: YiiX family permuted papain-like enzyme [Acidobacteria bacterium]|nr:YiiX family permuted papain-like enzyme [Acidobacteriota bacterium]
MRFFAERYDAKAAKLAAVGRGDREIAFYEKAIRAASLSARAIFLLTAFFVACRLPGQPMTVRSGDVVFHTSRSAQSLAIQRATGSKYSHMGIVMFRGGQPYVLEAIATVRWTPLESWVARGDGGDVVVKRLKNATDLLTQTALDRVTTESKRFIGKPYDLTFEWSDDRIYCSELVWKLFKRSLGIEVGSLQRVRDFNLSDPIVRGKMRERYGNHIPLEEPVISPAAMFNSPLLVTVAQR